MLTHPPAITFVLAPLPNSICGRCARADDISPEYNSAYVDFGRFLTGVLVVSALRGAWRSASCQSGGRGSMLVAARSHLAVIGAASWAAKPASPSSLRALHSMPHIPSIPANPPGNRLCPPRRSRALGSHQVAGVLDVDRRRPARVRHHHGLLWLVWLWQRRRLLGGERREEGEARRETDWQTDKTKQPAYEWRVAIPFVSLVIPRRTLLIRCIVSTCVAAATVTSMVATATGMCRAGAESVAHAPPAAAHAHRPTPRRHCLVKTMSTCSTSFAFSRH